MINKMKQTINQKWLALPLMALWLLVATAPLFAAPSKPLAGETYFSDDVTIESGRTVDGDLVVYSGNVKVEEGATVAGNLIAYSGDVNVQQGAVVKGDVTAWSGEIAVDGTVDGSVAGWSGDIELGEDALITGNVSAMSGDIHRGDHVIVQGSVVRGPGFVWPGSINPFEALGWGKNTATAPELPATPVPPKTPEVSEVPSVTLQRPDLPDLPEIDVATQVRNPVRGFVNFVLRVIGAMLFTAAIALLAGLVYYVRPNLVERVRRGVDEQPVYAGIAGIVVNLPLSLIAGLLFITFCLAPLALPPLLLLLVLNIVGLTGIAQIVGERVSRSFNLRFEPGFVIVIGAAVVVGVLSLLWAFQGCPRFFAYLGGLIIGSVGTGALILPWLRNLNTGSFGSNLPSAYTGSYSGTSYSGETVAGSHTSSDAPVNTSPVVVDIGSEKPNAAPFTPATPSVPTPPATPFEPVVPPVEVKPAAMSNDAPPATPLVIDVGTPLQTMPSQTIPPQTPIAAPEMAPPPAPLTPDDFTIIKGIGVVLDRRLKAAGVNTFEQLAQLTPAALAEIFDRPQKWVEEDDIIGQARYFAEKK